QKPEWNMLGDFEGAFNLVHGVDAVGPVGGRDVDGRRAGASPLVVGVQRRVHGVQGNAGGAEPIGDFAHMLLAVGVVEMLAGSEDFDRLGPGLDELVEQARMEPFLYVDVCRYGPQHQYPTAFPLLRPSLAPRRSPVLGSTMMHSPSPQKCSTFSWCPLEPRTFIVSGERRSSTRISSG